MKVAALSTLLCLLTIAQASNNYFRVPNTSVSYRVSREKTGENNSSIFLDDSSKKSTITIACFNYAPIFYITVPEKILTQQQARDSIIPDLYIRADSAKKVGRFEAAAVGDEATTDFNTIGGWENDQQIVSLMLSEKKSVTVQFKVVTGKYVRYTFPTAGLASTFKLLRNCK
ncbi:hypothetical protein SAMN00790413_04710 [Deinococcus hopiensis KR-140]|uniref:Uncharacterized protein n=2 Tax=Deinococcus TaxID=1298 RepID=A0A1W1ULT0_9DEIO|nr:hypothetical protein SAMN00790413_04710 [Deinococcus hopiensis KR-140]